MVRLGREPLLVVLLNDRGERVKDIQDGCSRFAAERGQVNDDGGGFRFHEVNSRGYRRVVVRRGAEVSGGAKTSK